MKSQLQQMLVFIRRICVWVHPRMPNVGAWVALVGLLFPLVTRSQTIGISSVSYAGDELFIGVSGPRGEKFIIDTSRDLFFWRPVLTNAFDPFRFTTNFVYLPVTVPTAFYRARRFEASELCSPPICASETTGSTCPGYGPPDEPGVRNASIPSLNSPMKSIRLQFHILADDDGSNPATGSEEVIAQTERLNNEFRPHRLQFVCTVLTNRSSPHRHLLSLSGAQEMMTALAERPESQHNVFITSAPPGLRGASMYPWVTNESGVPVSLTAAGSTLISLARFGGSEVALVHELGHAFGLWHTHHGSELEPACSPCWESATAQDADTTGDRCSDTPATPVDGNCQPLAPIDTCSLKSWPQVGLNNFMSGAYWCQGLFTPQQAGRMHAWIDYRLSGWLDTNTPAGPTDLRVTASDFGTVELTWVDNSWNETGFRIERSITNGPFLFLTEVPADATSFYDDTGVPRASHRYRLIAVNSRSPLAISTSYPTPGSGPAVPRVSLASVVHLDVNSEAAEEIGTADAPFRSFAQTLRTVPDQRTNILRVRVGNYAESLLISNRAVRVEALSGNVTVGVPVAK
jgi:hypothetical protein